ncbi:suppressor of fused domain protein [Pelosinus sp. IPA-1]|uniref:suppressor of fused domain protein n=1 Tax=Pelosinus sp. IPA-1 TaxID=3029569 RepID=UPI0024361D20|nr:suppressor of fused domain protein [Pelosinus sp. IPA-1]GMA98787.1 antitoxin YqcF [Pelosinus sp. IPA-1]
MVDTEKTNSKLISYIQYALESNAKIRRFFTDKSTFTRRAGWKEKLSFDILTFQNIPQSGVTTYATLGLSEYLLKDDQHNKPPRRVELVSILRDDTDFKKLTGDSEDKENFYEDQLMYLCCYMAIEGSYLFPGDIWKMYFSNSYDQFSDMEHLFFMTSTFLSKQLQSTVIDGKEIDWLFCVPISDKELTYYEKNGPEELEKLLLKNKIEVSDLFRKSVI